ncbi:MAG: putative metal-binding motif-containing protein [Sorangiineae bacterium]|nr:putative metal-binding motif-containing protein [Polyangiaceae bacterium]MEB2321230.1 putative metal-binding motif-containing protein [Sorangiineae bacterium]
MLLSRSVPLALGGATLVALALAPLGCGAKSGLRGALADAGADAGADADLDAGTDADADGSPECEADSDCRTDDLCSTRACVEGVCQAPLPVDCDDADECTADRCVPETGACERKPLTLDQDGDGHPGPRPGHAPGSPGACGDDCDDTNPRAYPGGKEVCDGVDNDCNGVVDDDMSYVPAGSGDVVISGGHKQAGIGGAAWNGELYAASYTAQDTRWRNYVKGLAADGSTAFDETAITAMTSDSYSGPVVWTGAMFGTAWEDRRDGNYEIYFNRLGKRGDKLSADLRLTDAGNFSLHPAVVWNGVEFLVVWDDRRDGVASIYGQRVDVDGNKVGGNVAVSSTGIAAESPVLAEGEASLGVVYNVGDPSNPSVMFRLLRPDLTASAAPIVLSTNDATDAVIVFSGDRYVAAWSTRSSVPGDSIWGATIGEDGAIIQPAKRLTTGASFARSESLLPLGDRLLLVWADDHDGNYELYSKLLSPALEELSPRARITHDGADSVNPIAVFGPNGDVGVVFDDTRSGTWRSYFTRLVCQAGGGGD